MVMWTPSDMVVVVQVWNWLLGSHGRNVVKFITNIFEWVRATKNSNRYSLKNDIRSSEIMLQVHTMFHVPAALTDENPTTRFDNLAEFFMMQ